MPELHPLVERALATADLCDADLWREINAPFVAAAEAGKFGPAGGPGDTPAVLVSDDEARASVQAADLIIRRAQHAAAAARASRLADVPHTPIWQVMAPAMARWIVRRFPKPAAPGDTLLDKIRTENALILQPPKDSVQ